MEEIIKPQTETIEKKEVKEDVTINSDFIEIEVAEKKIKQMEELNKRLEENLKKQERLTAEMMLKGRGIAGTPPKTPDDEHREEAERIASSVGRSIKNLPN